MPPANHYVEGQYLQKVPSGAVSEVGSTSQMRSPTPFHTDTPGNVNMEPEIEGLEEEQQELPPEPSWKDFKKYFWHDGNLRTLIATSFCWFCLDLPFYGLGMNSPRITRAIVSIPFLCLESFRFLDFAAICFPSYVSSSSVLDLRTKTHTNLL
jgi:hypothetical protein